MRGWRRLIRTLTRIAFDDYLELVDTTGRVIREDKRGYIPGETPQILERLNIDPEQFIATSDATGRVIREDKHGFIPGETPRLLERLGIDPEQFIATAGRMLRQFGSAIGTPTNITDLCVARQIRYLRGGHGATRALFERPAA